MEKRSGNPAIPTGHEGWNELSEGQNVELIHDTRLPVEGTVDAITNDGKIIWITSVPQHRRIFHAEDGYRIKD